MVVTSKLVILLGKDANFRPLDLHRPKALFPVAGVPLLQHQISAAAKVPGMVEVILLGSFNADDSKGLRAFAASASASFNLRVRYVEETATGTAGGIYEHRDQIMRGNPDVFFVLHSDVCCDFPLEDMLAFHQSVGDGSHLTLLSVAANHAQAMNYGCIVANEHGAVQHYVEKPSTFVSDAINCGVYLFTPRLFDDLRDAHFLAVDRAERADPDAAPAALSIERDLVIPLAAAGTDRIFVFRSKTFWSQIKTAASSIYASRHYLSRLRADTPAILAANAPGEFTVVGDVRVDCTSEVDATAKLGPNVTIGAGVTVGPGVRIRDSIILSNVTVGAHCCILNSIVDTGCKIGPWTRIEGAPISVNPNDPTTAVRSKPLFNSDGRLEPSVTILGAGVTVAKEIMVLNSVVLPHKELTHTRKNEIIL